jgi:hypothetical protein
MKGKHLLIIGLLIVIVSIIPMTIVVHNITYNKVEVHCYDGNGNKILGLSCEKEEMEKPLMYYPSAGIFLLGLLIGGYCVCKSAKYSDLGSER